MSLSIIRIALTGSEQSYQLPNTVTRVIIQATGASLVLASQPGGTTSNYFTIADGETVELIGDHLRAQYVYFKGTSGQYIEFLFEHEFGE